MDVPDREYTLDTFIDYVAEQGINVLSERDRRNEIKVLFHLTDRQDWESLFDSYPVEWLGEVLRVKAPISSRAKSVESPDNYFVLPYDSGLLALITSATIERHDRGLGKDLYFTRGITEMWIPPPQFESILDDLEDRYPSMRITNFVARRDPNDQTESRWRPEFERRFNYTGLDGRDVLKELRRYYGVHPTSVHCDLAPGVSLKVYEDGRFILRDINQETFEELRQIISQIREDMLELRSTATGLHFDISALDTELGTVKMPNIQAGKVALNSVDLTGPVADQFVKNARDFSFLDLSIHEGSLSFSATVVDEIKRAVFDLSGTRNSLTLIPKYQTTFESFLRFYRYVTESLDSKASFVADGGQLG